MNSYAHDFTTGDRIKLYRQRKGLSQSALAGLIGRSEDWVSKVERGVIPVDKLSVLLDLARVLDIRELVELTGRNLALTVHSSPEHDSVPAIRHALTAISSRLGADLPGTPLTPDELQQRIGEAWHAYEHEVDRYAIVGPQLPQLLAEARHASRHAAGPDEEQVARAEIGLYHLLQVYLRRVGERILSRVAADRALQLADQIGDPVLIGASAWNMCSVLTSTGDVAESADLARSAMEITAPGDDASPELLSVHGALHLAAAVATMRDNRAATAWDLLHSADQVARRVGTDRNDWRTSFGPTNVAMHGVHLAGEEGDATEALRLADSINDDNPVLPLERRTRYLVEVMNANRLKQDDYATLYMVGRIRKASPEEVKFFPLVREAVRDLLKRERPSYRAELRDHAAYVGVLAG
ncbi:helix-turn-helix domain-containing protein [Streptomyces morookaense]|uniref:Helix-turn-helix domain-containing protein n=1 Tax=Streptomyces morookaense TaxID=1970 RepID=A0A7Y7E5N1_STRMO|nr:helix-turn-helix transcriptional regulator [Streptomyces morookaense]NVK76394.1 helix-turn-helix domain-containing protein [Streptomyces morookaense]GHF06721.1 transcriptional regulator [Streptomyces morookaense]